MMLDNKIISPHSLPPGQIIDLPQHALQQEIKRTKMAENWQRMFDELNG